MTETTNIVKCFGVKKVRQDNSEVFYCLLEYMPEGSLFDLMEKRQNEKFSEAHCLKIFKQVCSGIRVMHSMSPPLAHRDLKIENILFDGQNFKLCDFGSVSSDVVDFKYAPLTRLIAKKDYEQAMEEFDKKTTITYRPPEMCDPYLQLKVDVKADIWMLGCILFALAFFKHPFQECTTLSIVNASYYLPANHKFSRNFENFVRNLLTPDPALRYDIHQIMHILDNWDSVTVELNVGLVDELETSRGSQERADEAAEHLERGRLEEHLEERRRPDRHPRHFQAEEKRLLGRKLPKRADARRVRGLQRRRAEKVSPVAEEPLPQPSAARQKRDGLQPACRARE